MADKHLAQEDFDLSKVEMLIVEDEPDVLLGMKRLLEVYRARLTIASSGQEALDLIQRRSFGIMLVDIQMPNITGWDFVKAVRNHPDPDTRNAYLIAITARVSPNDAPKVLNAGYDEYVSKPVDVITFIRHLHELIAK